MTSVGTVPPTEADVIRLLAKVFFSSISSYALLEGITIETSNFIMFLISMGR